MTGDPLWKRPQVVIGALAVALVGAGAGFALTRGAPDNGRAGGPELQIALAAAPEPVIEDGPIMGVGELTDGFDREALNRTAQGLDEAESFWAEAVDEVADRLWAEPPPRAYTPPVYEEEDVLPEPRQPVREEARRERRWSSFGYDEPRPDWAAERRARREEQEARQAERDRLPDGAELSRDSTFY
jgi:hypothetical protein